MDRDRRPIAFALKATIAAAVAFIVALSVIGALMVRFVEARLYSDLAARVSEEVVLFSKIYEDEGAAGLQQAVAALTTYDVGDQRIVAGFMPDGSLVAGNLKLRPDFLGWGTITQESPLERTTYRARVDDLGSVVLVVGRSMAQITTTRRVLVQILLLAGAAVVAVTLAIGVFLGRRTQRKLTALSRSLERVADGDLSVRLPVGRERDEIDRTAWLMNAQLERLQVATEALRNTVVAVAHDLRTPLNRVALLIQAAERDDASGDGVVPAEPSAPRETKLTEAQDEIARLSATFDAILRIARIEAGGLGPAVGPASAAAIVREIAETYAPVLEANGQQLTTVCSEDDVTIHCDETMIFQMLANLVENASLHTPAGTKVQIRVSGGARPVIEVADNGPGIAPADRVAAMRPFEQLAARGDLKGTGLGLALVRAIAERHNAQLELLDNGPGLRVRIAFPKVSPPGRG